jgi:hypothetical protein
VRLEVVQRRVFVRANLVRWGILVSVQASQYKLWNQKLLPHCMPRLSGLFLRSLAVGMIAKPVPYPFQQL